MVEGEASIPELQIAQDELREFQDAARKLVGIPFFGKEKLRTKDFPVTTDDGERIVTVSVLGDTTDVTSRETEPINQQYPYEKLTITTSDGTHFFPFYDQGTMVTDGEGHFHDPRLSEASSRMLADEQVGFHEAQHSIGAKALSRRLQGEPIDEFGKMSHLLKQIESSQRTTGKGLKNLIRRRRPHK